MAKSCVPSTSKCVTVSNEVKNFHRLYEIIRNAQAHLRCLFEELYSKRFNTPWCSENGESLFQSLVSQHFLKDVNLKIRRGDISEWDFTTLSFVILKLSEKEREREAVIQLREIRNALSHLGGDWGVKDEDYEKHVRNLEIYLAALGLQDDQITGIMENATNLHFGDTKSLTEEQIKAYLDAIGLSEPDEDEIFSIRSAAGNIRINKSKIVYKEKTAKTKGNPEGGKEGFGLWLDYVDNFITAADEKESSQSESDSETNTEPEEGKAESECASFKKLPRSGKEMINNMRKMMEETKKDPKNAPKRAALNIAREVFSELGKNFERKAKQREREAYQQHNFNNTENTSISNDPCIDELD